MYGLPGRVGTQCKILTGSNTIWHRIVTDQKSSITVRSLPQNSLNMFTISKKYCCRKMDGNKILDVTELFRCYFDVSSIFFRSFFSVFSLSMFCLFCVFAFLCFVVLRFIIDPLFPLNYNFSDTKLCQCCTLPSYLFSFYSWIGAK